MMLAPLVTRVRNTSCLAVFRYSRRNRIGSHSNWTCWRRTSTLAIHTVSSSTLLRFSPAEVSHGKDLTQDEARGTIKSVLGVLAGAYESARACACVAHKASYPKRDPMEVAFEDLCSRFDHYLQRLRKSGSVQRGLVILEKSAHETTLQRMSVEFRTLGTSWGVIKNLVDTPLFVDCRASRVIQLADHVSYAVYRRYQAGDTQYLDLIGNKFDSEDGIVHGLAHKEPGNPDCMCIACLSRR